MPRTPLDVSCAFITQFVTPAPRPATPPALPQFSYTGVATESFLL